MYLSEENQMKYYRDAIMEHFDSMNASRYKFGIIDRNELNKTINLVEGYSVLCKSLRKNENESESFCRIVENLVKEFKYRKDTLNEGFENPFDDIDDVDDISVRYDEFCDVDDDEDSVKIGNVRLWNENTDGKVVYKDGKIVAGKYFAVNDTIETCPVRIIAPSDMYSKTVRDFSFEIDPENGVYGIPFGYGSYYRSTLDCNMDANADYEYVDGANKSIRIFATKPIRKGNEIILQADREMYDNEFNDSQFKYDKEPFYSIKNVSVM